MSVLLPHYTDIAPTAPPQPEQAEILDLTYLVGVLWQRKFSLVFAGLIAALIGGAWAVFIATPYFQATTVLMLSAPEEPLPSLGTLVPGLSSGNSVANTEVEIMRSRSLMGAVVEELGLSNDPEFNPETNRGIPFAIRGMLRQWVPPTWMAPDLALSPDQIRTLTIDRLISAISARNIPDSMVFEISVESDEAQKAATIANTLAEHYIRRQVDEKAYANEQIVQWLSTRVVELETQLETAQTELAKFSANMELITPETHASLALRLKELRLRITTYQTTESQRSTVRLQNQLAELRALEKELSTMLERQSQDLVRLQQLEREVGAAQIVHAQFMEQFKERAAQMDITQPDSLILSVAEAPVAPARPRSALVILMAAVLGAMLMAGRILRHEALQKSLYTQQDMEQETGHVALGQTSLLPRRWVKGMVSCIAKNADRKNAVSMRHLRSAVLAAQSNAPKTIMITSSLPNEGRTVLTMMLAHSFAQTGQRVLVIEGDLHRQGLQKIMKIPSGGLYEVLRKNTSLEEAIWRCDDLGVDILKGTKENMEPADLFCLVSFRRLLRNVRETYDVILIDTPPVLAVPDAKIIGEHVDSVIFVVKWGQTSVQAVNAGLNSLKKGGVGVSGLILSQVHPQRQRRYMTDYHAELREYCA